MIFADLVGIMGNEHHEAGKRVVAPVIYCFRDVLLETLGSVNLGEASWRLKVLGFAIPQNPLFLKEGEPIGMYIMYWNLGVLLLSFLLFEVRPFMRCMYSKEVRLIHLRLDGFLSLWKAEDTTSH